MPQEIDPHIRYSLQAAPLRPGRYSPVGEELCQVDVDTFFADCLYSIPPTGHSHSCLFQELV